MGMFAKELVRSIRGSWGRFLALAGIVALGCGFYAGLNMCGQNMRNTADAYYDGTHLYDIRLVSTMGFSDDQLAQVAEVEGVEEVAGGYSVDVMTQIHGERYATRLRSFDVDAAKESSASDDGMVVTSDDDGYLNRLVLVEGRWPESSDECLLSDSSSSGDIEIGDEVKVLYGTSDLDGVLEARTFTVVGFVHSPENVDDTAMGYTSIGSGEIQQCVFVTEDAFADDLAYTELFVRVDGAAEEAFGEEGYEDTVDEVKARLEDLSGDLSASRLAEVKLDAQSELDEARSDYEEQKADAEAQLAEAKEELDDALAELEAAEQRIASGQEALDEGYASLDALQDAIGQLDSAITDLDDAISQLDDAISQLDSLSEGYASLEEATSQRESLEGQATALETQIAATSDPEEQATLQSQLDAVNEALAVLPTAEELAETEAQLDAALAEAGLTSSSEISGKRDELASQRDGLVSQRDELKQKRADAQSQYDSARATLDAKAAELADGRSELASGRASYESGLAEYEQERQKAVDELADAAAQLDAAQADIDELEAPDVYVLDRNQNVGIKSYADDAGRMDNIASVFPLIFFLVAALVSLTTMTRMVEDDRIVIGTHKALGFSTASISMRYVAYALLASGIGAVVGIVGLTQLLPYVVHTAYGVMYYVPEEAFPLSVDAVVCVKSALAGIGITLAATWLAAWSTLRESPAALMLPKAPKPGKRILLERIGPLWRHLSFSWKVSLRNLFRYKRRLAMTIVGIAGCTALLLAGLGIRDSIWDIIALQYEGDDPIFSYNVLVGLDEGSSSAEFDEVEDVLAKEGGATSFARIDLENMQVSATGRDDAQSVRLIVSDDPSELEEFIDFRDRTTGEAVEYGPDSVVLTEKVANEMGVEVGDEFRVYEQDAIGNATGEGYVLTCTGITENYTMHYCYVGADAWREATGEDAADNAIITLTDGDEEARVDITSALDDYDEVETIMFNNEVIDTYRTSLVAVDMVMGVLVVAAAVLNFIVLYNLTNINILERVREIASLKVLGFTRREVVAYVFREIVVLVVLGSLLGLVLGTWLEHFVVLSAEVDAVMFGRAIHPASYLFAFAATIAFSCVVMVAMMPKLRRIDMVESLKSVD